MDSFTVCWPKGETKAQVKNHSWWLQRKIWKWIDAPMPFLVTGLCQQLAPTAGFWASGAQALPVFPRPYNVDK